MGFIRNTSMTVAARYVAMGAKGCTALIVATTLGATGAGTFALIRILPHVAAGLLGIGVTIAIPYLVGGQKYPVQKVTENTVALGLVLSAAGLAAWLVSSGLLRDHFYTELSESAVLLVGTVMPLVLLRNYLNSIQQGLQTFKAANIVLLAEEFGELLLVLPLLWVGDSVDGLKLVVVAAVSGAVASCLTAVVLLLRRGIWPFPRLHWEIAVESVRFGLKGHVGRLANTLTWRLDTMILSTFSSIEVVGCYAVASQVAELFRPLSHSLSYVLRPLMASLSVAEARVRGVFLYRRVFLLNLALVSVMALVGGQLILRVFGEEFSAAVPAFQILLIGLAVHGADGVLAGYNVGIGRPEFNTYTALAALAITVIGDLALIPPYGLIGAAMASSIAYSVKAVVLTAFFLSSAGITLSQLMGVKEYSPDAA